MHPCVCACPSKRVCWNWPTRISSSDAGLTDCEKPFVPDKRKKRVERLFQVVENLKVELLEYNKNCGIARLSLAFKFFLPDFPQRTMSHTRAARCTILAVSRWVMSSWLGQWKHLANGTQKPTDWRCQWPVGSFGSPQCWSDGKYSSALTVSKNHKCYFIIF